MIRICLSLVLVSLFWLSPLWGLAFNTMDTKTAESKQAMGNAALTGIVELTEANKQIAQENKEREREIFAARDKRRSEILQEYNWVEKAKARQAAGHVASPELQTFYLSLPIIFLGALALLVLRNVRTAKVNTAPQPPGHTAQEMLAKNMSRSYKDRFSLVKKVGVGEQLDLDDQLDADAQLHTGEQLDAEGKVDTDKQESLSDQ